jgi:hypothetical protein
MQNLLDCKKDYIDIILDNITVPICTLIYDTYKSCANIQEFQNKMAYIKNWNNHIIHENYVNIIKSCKQNYIVKLLNEIIIINIKLKSENKKINMKDIKFINPEDFIHLCLINTGIYCWKNAYLFSHKTLRTPQIQYHLNIIEKNIRKIIKITIRDCTPIDIILNNNNNDSEDLKKKYNLVNTKNDKNETITHVLLKGESTILEDELLRCIKFLVERGAPISSIDSYYLTPLFICIEKKYPKIHPQCRQYLKSNQMLLL